MSGKYKPKHSDYVFRKGYTEESAPRRFWECVNKNGPVIYSELGPCWVWTGTRSPGKKGLFYGKMAYGGKGKEVLAHRFSFFLRHGRWPEKPYVCHHCDNPICVNPDHLFEGDWWDNNRDMYQKGRGNLSGLEIGHALSRKSTPELVRKIRSIRASTDLSMREIGVMLSIPRKRVETALYKWKSLCD